MQFNRIYECILQVSLYRGYNDQSAIVVALKKKEKALISRLFDLVVGANDSHTISIADGVDSKFLTTLQTFLSNSGQTALEALEAKWPNYEADNKRHDLYTMLSTLSLLRNVFGEVCQYRLTAVFQRYIM